MRKDRASPNLKLIQNKIVARQFDDALNDLSELLVADQEDPEALYMSAVCRRYKADFPVALKLLTKLKEMSPEHGRAYQEEGHTFRDMGQVDAALLAYSRACHFNPALEASWREQHKLLVKKGLKLQAAQVKAQLERLQKLPPAKKAFNFTLQASIQYDRTINPLNGKRHGLNHLKRAA